MKRFDNRERIEREKKLITPSSIVFVKMAENGDIDEVTASEHADLFLQWQENMQCTVGMLLQYKGLLYKVLQDHTSQADWLPNKTPALYKVLGINENGIAEWSQPISATDAYNKGDIVMYKGICYRSLIDGNVWAPDEYPAGWEVFENENN